MDRLRVLQRHLAPDSDASDAAAPVAAAPTAARGALPTVDASVIERVLDPDPAKRAVKAKVNALFAGRPDLLVPHVEGLRKEEHRDLVRSILRAVVTDAGFRPLTLYDTDLSTYFYLGELLALVDLSATIKTGVQYSLWGASVLNLGTATHRDRWAADIDALKIPGCFAMTELGHGSNVAGLQTEAVFDPATDEWVINTPDDAALKWWIGNAAEDGQMATVFARLKVPAPPPSRGGAPSPAAAGSLVDHGVHAFVVPIRNGGRGSEACLPGVQILDCGYKVGLQGVDNGALRFTNVRIPRDHLLDRFATVDAAGMYASSLSPGKRFAATLGELTGGRVGLTGSSCAVLKAAVTIAVRYSATRAQFGPPGGPEVFVLDYPSQQDKLMPLLAAAYGLHFASRKLQTLFVAAKKAPAADAAADVHALSAGLKAYTTRLTAAALSTCREATGGHGYAASNRLGGWRSDHDIFQTFEGDNTVLLQQVAGLLLKRYKDRFSAHPLAASTAYVREWAGRALPANPLLAHDTADAHLRDPAFLRSALRHRVRRLLFTAAARLAKHTRRLGAFGAWSKCVPHLLHLANAHVEAVVFEEFSAAAASAPTAGGARAALTSLAALFALDRIEADVMYRNDEYVAADKAKAISKLATRLRASVRAAALPLVDAFDIPDHILRAPIGVSSIVSDPYRAYLRSTGFDC